MTIKEFSELCECNPQTLRYYDKIGLLVPAQTDPWTGYRYYDKEQALTFVKIKNLQEADFSIEEIQGLLSKSDEEIYKAFSEKIKVKEEQLKRIRSIQQSYLEEQNNMIKQIQKIMDTFLEAVKEEENIKEFGLTKEESSTLCERLKKTLGDSIKSVPEKPIKPEITLSEDFPENCDILDSPDYETVYSKDDWKHAYEFMNELPSLTPGTEYQCVCQTVSKPDAHMPFALMIIGTICGRNPDGVNIGCNVFASKDCKNHFYLLKRK